MRLLVACSNCQRRFDATGRSPGSHFHCHCGEVVTVQMIEGHEAAVVRCSSCGGPRTPGAANCTFCGAEFEAAELERKTVCPKCLTRCTDGAKFCHHCGNGLAAESLSAEASDLACPVCGEEVHLEHHQLGDGPAMLECPGCAGIWLEHAKIRELVERAREKSMTATAVPAGNRRRAPSPTQQRGPMYRSCPSCGCMMNRKNYGKGSGVVVDVCKQHGTWFDADELPAILRWVEEGGLRKAAQIEQDRERQDRRLAADRAARARRDAQSTPTGDFTPITGRDRGMLDVDDLLEGVYGAIGAVAGFFRR